MVATVGFIGLGDIGEPMARNLCKPFETVVYDLLPEAIDRLVESGAKPASSCREVGERCEVIGVCVLDDASTEAVIAGEEGILAGAAPDTVIAIHSTIHPDTAKKLAEKAALQGVHVRLKERNWINRWLNDLPNTRDCSFCADATRALTNE